MKKTKASIKVAFFRMWRGSTNFLRISPQKSLYPSHEEVKGLWLRFIPDSSSTDQVSTSELWLSTYLIY